MRFLSVCSGIEAASVAFGPLGWQAVAFSEIEKFPSAVLDYHYPDVPNLGDFTKIDTTKLGRVDILCGGTPCQSFSVAGLRGGLNDARGNLTLSFVELAHELADGNGLRNVIWENVVGVLSDKTGAFGCFLAGLVGADSAINPPTRGKWGSAGMVSGPKGRAAWRILDGQYFGIPQRRRRVIVVADFGNGADPAEVLFEQDSVRRHSPPSREAGKGTAADVAPSLVSSGRGVERTGDTRGQDPVIAVFDSPVASVGNRTSGPIDVATAVNAHGGPHGRLDFESETFVAQPIAFSAKDYGADASVDLSPTLRAGGHTTSHANAGVMPAIAFGWQNSASQGDSASTEIVPTLDKSKTPAVAFAENSRAEVVLSGGDGQTVSTLKTGGGKAGQSYPAAMVGSAVRRLTPRECERLQGFPDDYTLISIRKVSKANQNKALSASYHGDDKFKVIDGVAWVMSADGPRYKALGNSWAVPKFAWLGRRIQALMPVAANDNAALSEAA
ncbi:DNA cytosine methyltransferase [Sinorhizobium medicae]|nr:DNA cytosine methyltransferase [Sinorhizobium medicae]